MIWAALSLFQATGDSTYLATAEGWVRILDTHYWDADDGGYFTAADDTKDVIVRLKPGTDDATPSANAIMVSNLALLALLTGNQEYQQRGEAIARAFAPDIAQNLAAHTGLLAASMDLLAPQLVVVASDGTTDENHELQQQLHALSIPGAAELTTTPGASSASVAALDGKSPVDGKPAAYVCLGPECALPVTTPDALRDLIVEMRSTTEGA